MGWSTGIYHPQVASKVDLIKTYPHVFLSHTFSKAFGLAGIRFGYVVAVPELVEAFTKMYLPWNMSLMAMAAAEAILDNPDEIKGKVKYNNDWMDTFTKELKAVGLNPYPAHGNYMLIDASVSGKTTGEIVKASGLAQVSDSGTIEKMADQAIAENPKSVEDYKGGKTAAFKFLIGQVMKLSKGKANPQLAAEILKSKLG